MNTSSSRDFSRKFGKKIITRNKRVQGYFYNSHSYNVINRNISFQANSLSYSANVLHNPNARSYNVRHTTNKANSGYLGHISTQSIREEEEDQSTMGCYEEDTLRKIRTTSDMIKRQLMSPDHNDATKDTENISSKFKGKQSIFLGESSKLSESNMASRLKKKPSRSSEEKIRLQLKHKRRNELREKFKKDNIAKQKSSEIYNVKEISDQLIKHISKMNNGRLVHFLNTNRHEEAFSYICKQKSFELTKALRDLSHQEKPEACELVNSIIPDFSIKIEELPINVIRELSSTFDKWHKNIEISCLSDVSLHLLENHENLNNTDDEVQCIEQTTSTERNKHENVLISPINSENENNHANIIHIEILDSDEDNLLEKEENPSSHTETNALIENIDMVRPARLSSPSNIPESPSCEDENIPIHLVKSEESCITIASSTIESNLTNENSEADIKIEQQGLEESMKEDLDSSFLSSMGGIENVDTSIPPEIDDSDLQPRIGSVWVSRNIFPESVTTHEKENSEKEHTNENLIENSECHTVAYQKDKVSNDSIWVSRSTFPELVTCSEKIDLEKGQANECPIENSECHTVATPGNNVSNNLTSSSTNEEYQPVLVVNEVIHNILDQTSRVKQEEDLIEPNYLNSENCVLPNNSNNHYLNDESTPIERAIVINNLNEKSGETNEFTLKENMPVTSLEPNSQLNPSKKQVSPKDHSTNNKTTASSMAMQNFQFCLAKEQVPTKNHPTNDKIPETSVKIHNSPLRLEKPHVSPKNYSTNNKTPVPSAEIPNSQLDLWKQQIFSTNDKSPVEITNSEPHLSKSQVSPKKHPTNDKTTSDADSTVQNEFISLTINSFEKPKSIMDAIKLMGVIDENIEKLTKLRQNIFTELGESEENSKAVTPESKKRKLNDSMGSPNCNKYSDRRYQVDRRYQSDRRYHNDRKYYTERRQYRERSPAREHPFEGLKNLKEVVLHCKILYDKSECIVGTDKGKIHYFNIFGKYPLRSYSVSNSAISFLEFIRINYKNYVCSGDSTELELRIMAYKTDVIQMKIYLEDTVQVLKNEWGFLFIGGKRGFLTRYDWKKQAIQYEDRISNDSRIEDLKTASEGPRKILVILFQDQDGNSSVHVRDAMTLLHIRTVADAKDVRCMHMRYSSVFLVSNDQISVHNYYDGTFVKNVSTKKSFTSMIYKGNIMILRAADGIYAFNTKTNEYLGCLREENSISSLIFFDKKILCCTWQRKIELIDIPDSFIKILEDH